MVSMKISDSNKPMVSPQDRFPKCIISRTVLENHEKMMVELVKYVNKKTIDYIFGLHDSFYDSDDDDW